MINNINITPESAYAEITDWWQQYMAYQQHKYDIDTVTPGTSDVDIVAKFEHVKLLRFKSHIQKRQSPPLLISYALVNRFTIADLQEDKSLVARLLELGYDIYCLDWGYVGRADRMVDLDEYINGYLDTAVNYILNHHNIDSINILGICQGGVLAASYTALHPEKIKNLITMVMPVDFQTKDDLLSHMVQHIDINLAIKAYGNLSGQALNLNFSGMQPISLNIKKWLDSVYTLSDVNKGQFFMRMEKWINDSPDQAGRAYEEFIGQCYHHNALVKGNFTVGDKIVNYKNITHPVLNIFGNKDHLVPSASSKALKDIINTRDYEEYAVNTGHIGMYVSRQAKDVPHHISKWLGKH